MGIESRRTIYEKIETDRKSKVLLYATSDRPQMEAQIANDAFDYFVQHLDRIWPASKITLILHTAGGDSAAAWRIINLLRIFCDDLEVLIPNRAHSAGTLISLGASRILMTKQATLGPIDPSLTGPLSPMVPGQPHQRVPVSVEAVQGYIDLAKNEMGIGEDAALGQILVNLAQHVHPLVLGQIFRSRNQIRSLAKTLLEGSGIDAESRGRIIDFLCSESGSHDRTINRREARQLGLNVEKPSESLYALISELYEDYAQDMELRQRFEPMTILKGQPRATFSCQRVLIESVNGGSTQRLTNGEINLVTAQQVAGPGLPPMPVSGAEVKITFEGWEQR